VVVERSNQFFKFILYCNNTQDNAKFMIPKICNVLLVCYKQVSTLCNQNTALQIVIVRWHSEKSNMPLFITLPMHIFFVGQ
jgi:hypothetical protein